MIDDRAFAVSERRTDRPIIVLVKAIASISTQLDDDHKATDLAIITLMNGECIQCNESFEVVYAAWNQKVAWAAERFMNNNGVYPRAAS